MKNAFMPSTSRRSLCGIWVIRLAIFCRALIRFSGAPVMSAGAPVGRVLTVAREGSDEDEADHVGHDRDERPRSARREPGCCCRGCCRRRTCSSRRPIRTSIAATMAKKLATVMITTSRLATCESSCASTPSTSCGSRRSQRPRVTATAACLRAAARREGVRHVGVDDCDPRLGQVGQRAQPLDHVVQVGRLVALDDLRPGGRERDLVGREQLKRAAGRPSAGSTSPMPRLRSWMRTTKKTT